MKLNLPIEKCDCILVLGSHDVTPARYGIELFKQGYAKHIVFSGGFIQNKPEHGIVFAKTEAEEFADIAREYGVPESAIIVENQSKNTEENLVFTARTLKERGFDCKSFLIVQKPYDERRLVALAGRVWPDKKVIVTSKPTTYEEYINGSIPKELVLNKLVGILQRVKVYGERGLQIPQEIPPQVWEAYEKMVELGFNKSMIG